MKEVVLALSLHCQEQFQVALASLSQQHTLIISSLLSWSTCPALLHQHVIPLEAADGLLESSKRSWQNETQITDVFVSILNWISQSHFWKLLWKSKTNRHQGNIIFFDHGSCCRSKQQAFDLWIDAWHKIELLSRAMYASLVNFAHFRLLFLFLLLVQWLWTSSEPGPENWPPQLVKEVSWSLEKNRTGAVVTMSLRRLLNAQHTGLRSTSRHVCYEPGYQHGNAIIHLCTTTRKAWPLPYTLSDCLQVTVNPQH